MDAFEEIAFTAVCPLAIEQDAGLAGQVSGTKGLEELAADGMKIRKQLQAIVRNKFKREAAVLAEWQSAQHVERTPRSPAPEPAPAG